MCVHMRTHAHLAPLRIELFWISPVVISEVQVKQRNGYKAAFLYWYSIDHSVLVASSVDPAWDQTSEPEHARAVNTTQCLAKLLSILLFVFALNEQDCQNIKPF